MWSNIEVDVGVSTEDLDSGKALATDVAAVGLLLVRQMHAITVLFQALLQQLIKNGYPPRLTGRRNKIQVLCILKAQSAFCIVISDGDLESFFSKFNHCLQKKIVIKIIKKIINIVP